MKYLITGGAGFIGCNLARYILNEGHNVVIPIGIPLPLPDNGITRCGFNKGTVP